MVRKILKTALEIMMQTDVAAYVLPNVNVAVATPDSSRDGNVKGIL